MQKTKIQITFFLNLHEHIIVTPNSFFILGILMLLFTETYKKLI